MLFRPVLVSDSLQTFLFANLLCSIVDDKLRMKLFGFLFRLSHVPPTSSLCDDQLDQRFNPGLSKLDVRIALEQKRKHNKKRKSDKKKRQLAIGKDEGGETRVREEDERNGIE